MITPAPSTEATRRRKPASASLTGASLVEEPLPDPSPSSINSKNDDILENLGEPKGSCCARDDSHCHSQANSINSQFSSLPLRQCLTLLFRNAPYERLLEFCESDPRIKAILSSSEAEDEHKLLGNDPAGHSLCHWAAKRSDVRFLSFLSDQLYPALYPSAESRAFSELSAPATDDAALSPLHWAAADGHTAVIAMLLSLMSSPEARKASVNQTSTSNGATPLIVSCQYGHSTTAALLALRHDADVMATDNNGDTALHWAAYKGDVPTLALLCQLIDREGGGGNRGDGLSSSLLDVINMTDAYGQTPLHLASLRGHAEALEFLLYSVVPDTQRKNINYQLKDNKDSTPLEIAHRKRHHDVSHVLERFDADRKGSAGNFTSFCVSCKGKTWREALVYTFLGGGATRKRGWAMVLALSIMLVGEICWQLELGPNSPPGWKLYTRFFLVASYASLLTVHLSDPGIVDGDSSVEEARRIASDAARRYHAALDALAAGGGQDGDDGDLPNMCHTTQIVKPVRSKYCRVMRKNVLVFDHFCPFVGNAIGLYNYRYFYLFLICLINSYIGWYTCATLYIMEHGTNTFVIGSALTLFTFLLPVVGLTIFHTRLIFQNLTTNEMQNRHRYKYLRNDEGLFFNPFDKGFLQNVKMRLFPSKEAFTLPDARGESFREMTELLRVGVDMV